MLHAVETGRGTIKQSAGRLRDSAVARRASEKHRMHLRTRGCAIAWEGWKVTIAVIFHDKMSHLRHRGADDGKLRHRVNCKNRINEP